MIQMGGSESARLVGCAVRAASVFLCLAGLSSLHQLALFDARHRPPRLGQQRGAHAMEVPA